MHHHSGERFLLNQIGQHRLGEQSDGRDHHVEIVTLTGGRRQLPTAPVVVPTCGTDFSAESQVWLQALRGNASLEVLQDLPLSGPQPRPVWVQVERIGIQMRLDVTRQPWVGIDPPGPADAVFAIENREVMKPGPHQQNSQRDTARSGADDADLHWILRHWPPSMTSSEPVMNDAWPETRKAIASATSDGCPIRPDTDVAASRAWVCASSIGVAIGPGNTALTRIPAGASSAAAAWV